MRKKTLRLLSMLLAVITLIGTMALPAFAAEADGGGGNTAPIISDVGEILNTQTYAEYKVDPENIKVQKGEKPVVIDATKYLSYKVGKEYKTLDVSKNVGEAGNKKDGLYVPYNGTVTWEFELEKAGKYAVQIEYLQTGDKTNSIERVFYINGDVPFSEARSIVLNKVWTYQYVTIDGKQSFEMEVVKDEGGKVVYGDDIRPKVIQSYEWVTYTVADSNGFYTEPFEFCFKKGKNTISFEGQREPVIINSITLLPLESAPSYKDYLNSLKDKGLTPENNRADAVLDVIQAEAPDRVSAVTMYPVNDRTSPLTQGYTGDGEQSPTYIKFNTAGKEKWQNVGEWMTYTIDVKEAGFYSIGVRYKQALLSGMSVSRKVYIDGVIPFAEASDCRFPYTSSWETVYLNNGGDPFEFYLTEGKHTLKLEVGLGEMGDIIQRVSNSLNNINNCYLEILKLTGSTPDANRSYGFSRVMPDTLNQMAIESGNLKAVFEDLLALSGGKKNEKTSTIEQVYLLLEKMTDEDEIAGNLGSLKSHIGSLGTWINSIKIQPLQVDSYVIQSCEKELPRGDANFFGSFWFEIKLFFASFFTDYSDMSGTDGEGADNSIQVWVVTGRDQAQIIRNLVDNTFTPNSAKDPKDQIHVDLKLVAGNTLLPSVLAGVGPDVSLMESSTMIIDYAIRDAVTPLNKFISQKENAGEYEQLTPEDKANSVLANFPAAAMVPLTLYDYDSKNGTTKEIIYGLPDSLTFSMMFYRKDVLASLGYDISDIKTWDDLLSILPILQYNNMEIGIQNDIYTFIYQSGYEAYKDSGMRINFDDTGVLTAFTKLCNMYTQYSLPYQFDFANRFRTGEMPIGIAAYTTCNQLAIFASELSGLWGFVPLPGYEVTDAKGNVILDANGEPIINNSAIATVTGCVMLDGCDNPESAWKFMEWYTGAECQIAYSDEIVSIVGIASRPATANIEAITELPWTAEEATNILAQFGNLAAVPNHPGSYYLARYVNFAFLAAYNDGKDPADALLSYVPTINKEITRKRTEFQSENFIMEVYKDDEDEE